jgi:hypothetical protein
MERANLRTRLFRLVIALKLAMWTVIALVLAIGISDLVRGREAGPPLALLWAIPALIAAQLVAILAWRRMGRDE